MEIIDVLTLPPDYQMYFTVNNAVRSVDLLRTSLGADASNGWMRASGGSRHTFHKSDSFFVLTMGYVLPDGFCMASPLISGKSTQNYLSLALGLQVLKTDTIHFIPNFYTHGMMIPMENYEMPVNVFVDVNKVNPPAYVYRKNTFHLMGIQGGMNENTSPPEYHPQVSMIGVPPALNGQVFYVNFFVKILHNYELT